MRRALLAVAQRARQRLGDNGFRGASSGGCRIGSEDYAAAKPWARRALEIRAHAVGLDHTDAATDAVALAAIADSWGRHQKAEVLLVRAISVLETHSGSDHEETGCALHNLAACVHAQGRLDEAEQLYRRALYKAELINRRAHGAPPRRWNGPSPSGVAWWNNQRLHRSCGRLPPAEYEENW